jgi:hypothetical protein
MALARQLQATQIAAGGTHHTGAAYAREQGRQRARAMRGKRMTSGA